MYGNTNKTGLLSDSVYLHPSILDWGRFYEKIEFLNLYKQRFFASKREKHLSV